MKNVLIIIFIFLQICQTSQSQDTIRKEFHSILIEDNFFNVNRSDTVICKLLLANNDSLYLIRAISSKEIISRVYDKNKKFDLIISDTSDYLGYQGDTLFDANFDGYADYIVNYYSPAGCCPREEKRVFLLKQTNTALIKPLVFLNSHFDPTNKYVVSMGYGQPDPPMGIGLSRYIWKKDELVEVQSVLKKDNETLIIYDPRTDKKREIKYLPEEYKKIKMIDWFWVE